MTQYSAIVPICFVLTSGCALFDDLAPNTESAPTPITVSEKEEVVAPITAAEVSDPQLIKPPPIPRRVLRVDEVRRLQKQLRRIGLDPGPVDGIVGARTRAAFGRLHATCEKLGASIESFHALVTQASSARVISIDETETRRLQGELRGVGLDPGPVDGILGKRTRSMVEQLHGSCLMAKESGAILRDVSPSVPNDSRSGDLPSSANASAASYEPRSREDVRILQLRLRDAGFDPGPFDGIMGPKTSAALAQYEASQRGRKIKTSLMGTISGEQY